jgi:acetolactate synthase-1/2/3 large subunit
MSTNRKEWLDKVLHWKNKWSQFLPEYEDDKNGINLYKFTEVLNKHLKDDSVIVSDAGSVGYVLAQSLELKDGQRYLADAGQMAMGAWPLAIGVCLANNKKQTIVCTGDGSFNFCPHALATIRELDLPIVIFIWNNDGFLSIKNTSDAFYGGRRFGTDSSNGLFFPEIQDIAFAYQIEYLYCRRIEYLNGTIKLALENDKPIIIEIKCDPTQKIVPGLTMKNGKSCELNDMAPFISDEEMILETIED